MGWSNLKKAMVKPQMLDPKVQIIPGEKIEVDLKEEPEMMSKEDEDEEDSAEDREQQAQD